MQLRQEQARAAAEFESHLCLESFERGEVVMAVGASCLSPPAARELLLDHTWSDLHLELPAAPFLATHNAGHMLS